MKKATGGLAALAVACLITAPAMGVGYVELVPWSIVQDGGSATSHWTHVIDGQTSYHTVNLGSAPQITKVTNLNGVQSSSLLVTPGAWAAASGQTSMANAHGFGISNGTDLMWTDTGSDAVWKASLSTGAITEYVSKAQILAHTGQTGASSLTPNVIHPNGEFVWYEGTSDDILITTGLGTLTTLVSAAQLTAAQGNTTVSGGMTYDASGNLYWGNSTNDSIFARASDGTLYEALTTADILAVSGAASAGFGDIFAAPDGLIYFYESTADNIMRFDPADAANTLMTYVSEAELNAGPMAGDNVQSMGWYDGNLTWTTFGETGLFVVPEPATLALLGLGGLALIRRRG